MGNVNSVSGRGANAIEMRDEPSADGGIGEVAFHHAELALGGIFSLIEFDTLAFYCLELALMRSIPINVSDNTRILEVYDGVVDDESRGRRRMEDVEVVIFDPRAIEIGRGVCPCVKGDRVFGVALLASPHEVSVNPNLSKGDVSCDFVLPILIEEDEGVLPRITAVILAPSEAWMIGVIYLDTKLGNVGDGARSGREGNGGVICGKPNWFFTLHVVIYHVTLNFVKNLRDKEEVFDGGIVTEGGGEDLVVKLSIPQDVNCWEKILRPSRKSPSYMSLPLHVLQQGSALSSHKTNHCRRGYLSR